MPFLALTPFSSRQHEEVKTFARRWTEMDADSGPFFSYLRSFNHAGKNILYGINCQELNMLKNIDTDQLKTGQAERA